MRTNDEVAARLRDFLDKFYRRDSGSAFFSDLDLRAILDERDAPRERLEAAEKVCRLAEEWDDLSLDADADENEFVCNSLSNAVKAWLERFGGRDSE